MNLNATNKLIKKTRRWHKKTGFSLFQRAACHFERKKKEAIFLHTLENELEQILELYEQKKQIIYFCIYGKDEYYQCFELALESLIMLGGYTGDILIKTDNETKVRSISKKYSNRFYFSNIDEKLGIFNRYWLHEEILKNYDSIAYLDCDILTIDLVDKVLYSFQEKGDFLAYIEADNKTYIKEHANRYSWWGANYLTYNGTIKLDDYFMYNFINIFLFRLFKDFK